MPVLVLWAAALSASVLVTASAVGNCLFLSSLGRTTLEAALFGAVSLAADVAKALLPVLMTLAWRQRKFGQLALGGLLLTVLIGFSLASGLGFAAVTRGGVSAEREQAAGLLRQAETAIADIDRQMAQLTASRGGAAIEEELRALAVDLRFINSKQCTEPQGRSAREFCTLFFRLRSELATARQVETLRQQRRRQQAKMETLRASGAGSESDPQAMAFATLLGVAAGQPRQWLGIAIAVVLELGSLGLVTLLAGPLADWRRERAAGLLRPKPAGLPPSADRTHWQRQIGASGRLGAGS